jgi:hypothetical protein
MTVLTFGKYKGSDLSEVPKDYLEWGVSKLDSSKWRKEFQNELDCRKNETQHLLNTDPDKLFGKLEREALSSIHQEMEGHEHEYDRVDIYTEAENRANSKLKALQADKALKELKIQYAGLLGIDLKMMDKMEQTYHCEQLGRSNFQTESKYKLAMEYFKKKDALLEVAITLYF